MRKSLLAIISVLPGAYRRPDFNFDVNLNYVASTRSLADVYGGWDALTRLLSHADEHAPSNPWNFLMIYIRCDAIRPNV